MPKRYPVEVRLFVAQKKREGHSWERVAEMVKQEFHLVSAPSRRQMTKWAAQGQGSVADLVATDIRERLPQYMPQWLVAQQGAMTKLIAEAMGGKDFGLLMGKWMLSEMEAVLGTERLMKVLAEFMEEKKRLPPEGKAAGDKVTGVATEEVRREGAEP